MMTGTATSVRSRRFAPGSVAFDATSGPATVVCGTRQGISRYGSDPTHYLIAPLDSDPATFRWPVQGASPCLLAMGADPTFVLALTRALLADGAELVCVINKGRASFHTNTAWRPS